MIQIRFENETVELGNEIVGQVSVSPNRKQLPKEIEIAAKWRTEGRGERDRGTVGTLSPELENLTWLTRQQFPFRFTIPDNVPISYDGDLIRFLWEVEVKLKFGWLKSQTEMAAFRVLPKNSWR